MTFLLPPGIKGLIVGEDIYHSLNLLYGRKWAADYIFLNPEIQKIALRKAESDKLVITRQLQ